MATEEPNAELAPLDASLPQDSDEPVHDDRVDGDEAKTSGVPLIAPRSVEEIMAGPPDLGQTEPVFEPTPNDPTDDFVLQAHQIRQASWEIDAKKIFKGKTEAELEREAMLTEMGVREAERQAEIAKQNAARERERRKSTAAAEAASIREHVAAMKADIKTLEAQARDLEKLAKE